MKKIATIFLLLIVISLSIASILYTPSELKEFLRPHPDTAESGPTNRVSDSPKDDLAYLGNRADFFSKFASPDPDWRQVLHPWMVEVLPEWSQGFEEILIRDYFRDIRGGFFLDVGCAGPYVASTTNYLEHYLNWSGIGIDVNNSFALSWEKHRPNSEFVCNAIYEKDGEELTLHIGIVIRSLDRSVVENFTGKESLIREVTVSTITLNTLLEQRGIEKVDFVSIDIEGAEMGALRGFDIQKYRPDLLCVETRYFEEVNAYFESNG